MNEEIFALAQSLGHVGAEEEAVLRTLCAAAEEELNHRLKEGVAAGDCGGAFQLAAAWLALSGLSAAGSSGVIQRFSAGDVTVEERSGGSTDRSAELRQQAERVMAPYLKDAGFVFRGVCG